MCGMGGGKMAVRLLWGRKRVVGEALVRHEGQYRCAAMVAGNISIDRTTTLSIAFWYSLLWLLERRKSERR
jgi:hypothetical protein